jgi:hypothetical protein
MFLQVYVLCVGWQPHATSLDDIYLSCPWWWCLVAYIYGLHLDGHLSWVGLTFDNHDRLEQVIYEILLLIWRFAFYYVALKCSMSQPYFGQVWGWSPTLGKSEDLESSGTPECSELDSNAQNTSHWGVLGVIGKVLKRRCRKWTHIGIWTSVAQVMGKRRAGSQTASLTPDH